MRDVGLSSIEICDILKACTASRVSKLEYANLKVEFSSEPQAMTAPSSKFIPIPAHADAIQEEEDKAFESAEIQSKSEQLSTMLLTDPAEYERLIMEGDLKEGHESYAQ
jgi:hypothetical protein